MAISEETMSHYAETTYGRRSKDVDEARRIYQPKQSDITGKIIIFTLAGLCILLFIFIIIGFFFIAKPLKASLTYVDVRSLSYNKDTSSSLYFNSTLAMEIRIENPNLGFFEFPTSKGDVLYNGQVVGEMRISGQRVASFGSIRTEVRTEVGYKGNQRSPVWLKNDIERRLIILNTRAKLRGEVHLKALNKRTVVPYAFLGTQPDVAREPQSEEEAANEYILYTIPFLENVKQWISVDAHGENYADGFIHYLTNFFIN